MKSSTAKTSYRDGWYYDTVTFGAGAAFAKTAMFSTPIGVGGKALNSTNLTGQGGQVPAGETLNARSIPDFDFKPGGTRGLCEHHRQRLGSIPGAKLPGLSVDAGMVSGRQWAVCERGCPVGHGSDRHGDRDLCDQRIPNAGSGLQPALSVHDGIAANFTILLTPETAFNMTAATGVNPLGVGASIRVYIEGDKQQVINGSSDGRRRRCLKRVESGGASAAYRGTLTLVETLHILPRDGVATVYPEFFGVPDLRWHGTSLRSGPRIHLRDGAVFL